MNKTLFKKFLLEEAVEEVYLEPQTLAGLNPNSVAPSVSRDVAHAPASSVKEQLLELRYQASQCTLCSELAEKRNNVVFGAGNIKADLMFVGEAPGFDEDQEGLPFVGKAGALLTKIIEAIGLTRKQVFIANVLKCRPPGNRSPQPDEILNCQPYIHKQIELINPKIICALGTFAGQTLLKTGTNISRLRGKFHDFPVSSLSHIRVMCTFHPAYLLRNPAEKRKVWEDMKQIRDELLKP